LDAGNATTLSQGYSNVTGLSTIIFRPQPKPAAGNLRRPPAVLPAAVSTFGHHLEQITMTNSSLSAGLPAPGEPNRPSTADLRAAEGKTLPDLIGPHLKVLFVGINPGLYSGATGRHFARPGNRFWPALHLAGITPRRLQPWEEEELLAAGYGITGMVRRATATAQELTPEEFRAGARRLQETVRTWRPGLVCFLGMGAYRTGFGRPRAQLGLQEETIEGTPVWVLPNPSGLNAHFSLDDFARLLRTVREDAERRLAGDPRAPDSPPSSRTRD
jgi:TDG/mug DNA glycosylase family protein